jgi:hypothetical protein
VTSRGGTSCAPLETFGYVVLRQSGNRPGTLAGVVADVAAHHGLSTDEVVQRLFGDL